MDSNRSDKVSPEKAAEPHVQQPEQPVDEQQSVPSENEEQLVLQQQQAPTISEVSGSLDVEMLDPAESTDLPVIGLENAIVESSVEPTARNTEEPESIIIESTSIPDKIISLIEENSPVSQQEKSVSEAQPELESSDISQVQEAESITSDFTEQQQRQQLRQQQESQEQNEPTVESHSQNEIPEVELINPEERTAQSDELSEEDFGAISAFFKIDLDELKEFDFSLVKILQSKLFEFEELKSNSTLLGLQFEQFRHSNNKKIQNLNKVVTTYKEQLSTSQKDKTQFQQQIQDLQAKLDSSVTDSNKNFTTLQQYNIKFQELNDSKRNAFEMLDKKQEQIIELNQDLNKVSSTNQNLRSKLIEIESDKETLSSEISKQKFSQSKLEQDLELSKRSSSWFESELKLKTDELQSLREQKRNEVTKLQSQLEKYKQESGVAKATNQTLSDSLKDISLRFEKASIQVKKLTDKLALNDQKFAEEMSSKDRLIQILERSSADRLNRIESLEKAIEENQEKVAHDEAEYKSQFELLREKINEKDVKVKELEETIGDLTQANFDGSVDTADILGSLSTGNQITVNSSAQKTLKNMGSSYSLTELISENNRMRRDLVREKRSRTKAEEELSTIFKELERRLPLLQSYRDKCTELESKEGQLAIIIDGLNKEKSVMRAKLDSSVKRSEELQFQIRKLDQYKVDLKRQVALLLAQVTFKNSGDAPLTREEKNYLNTLVGTAEDADLTDTDRLITQRLSTFKDINDLISKNEQLLVISRNLGQELEKRDQNGQNLIEDEENEAIQRAAEAIVKLKEQLQSTEAQLRSVTNSRDMLQQMIQNGNYSIAPSRSNSEERFANERIESLKSELSNKQEELKSLKKETDKQIFELHSKLQEAHSEKSSVALDLARAKSSLELLEQRSKSTQYLYNASKTEVEQLRANSSKLQENLSKLELRAEKITDELLNARTVRSNLEVQVKSLTSEKEICQSIEVRLRNEISQLLDEKAKLNSTVIKLQTLSSERDSASKQVQERLNVTITKLQKDLESSTSKYESSNEEIKRILHSKNTDSQVYQQRIDSLSSQLSTLKESLIVKTSAVEMLTGEVDTLRNKYEDITKRKSTAMAALSANTEDSEGVANLKQELSNALEDLESITRTSEEYKNISEAAEKELTSISDTYEKYKAASEEKIISITAELEDLKAKLSSVIDEKNKLGEELDSVKYDSHLKLEDYEMKVDQLNSTIETFEGIKENYESRLSVLQSEVTKRDELVRSSKAELQTKIDDFDAVSEVNDTLKAETDSLREKVNKLESDLNDSKSTYSVSEENWNTQKSSLDEEIRVKSVKILELDTQNRTLMNQLEVLPIQFNESSEGNSDMRSLITYLHREKDSLFQQLDYSKTEEKRIRHSLVMAENEIKELKTALAEAKENVEVSKKYSSLMEKMTEDSQELQLYKDNFKILRSQNEIYSKKASSLEKRLAQLAAQSEPLQDEVNRLKSELEIKQATLTTLTNQSDYWKSRAEHLMKGEEKSTETESKMSSQVKDLTTQLQERELAYTALQSKFDKMRKTSNEKIEQANTAKKNSVLEKVEQEKKVIELQKKFEEYKKSRGALEKQQATIGTTGSVGDSAALKAKIAQLESDLKEQEPAKKRLREKISNHFKEINDLKKQLEEAKKSTPSDDLIAKMKADFAKEKEAAIKAKEEELKKSQSAAIIPADSSEIEQFKKNIENELKEASAKSLTEEKKILMKKFQSITEKRFKARQEALEKEYETKFKELDEKLKGSSVVSTGSTISVPSESFENEKKELLKKFEDEKAGLVKKFEEEKSGLLKSFDHEKEKLKSDTSAAVRREFEFKDRIAKKQLTTLQEKVKKLEQHAGTVPATQGASTTSNVVPQITPILNPFNSQPGNFTPQSFATINSFIPTQNLSTSNTASSLPSLPQRPDSSQTQKRHADDSEEPSEKRVKTDSNDENK